MISTIVTIVLGAFPRVLICLVAADQTTRSSSEQSVMAGIVACYPTDDGTL